MASKYVTILESEFDEIFKSEKNWVKEYSNNTQEIVYTKNLKSKPHLQIRVYSTLKKDSGVSREVGDDSIKVCAINTVTQKGVRKSRRINRVQNWQTRLETRVLEMWKDIKQ